MSSAQKIIKIGAILFAVFLIISILEGILFGLHLLSGNPKRGDVDFHEIYQNVEQIDLDISASEIIIETGDNLEVNASDVSKKFKVEKKNDTLKIEEKNNHLWNSNIGGTITLTIPNNKKLKSLKVSSGAGKIKLQSITSDYAKIEVGAGSLSILNSIFYETKIDGGAGKVSIDSSILHNLDLNAGVGKVNIDADILGESKVECGVGEITLKLPKEEDYQLTLEKGIGKIEVNGESMKNETTYGHGENEINIEGGVGSIKINFAE